MKTKITLLSFVTAGLFATSPGLRADDPVPPTPPVNPPAAAHEGAPDRDHRPGGPGGPGGDRLAIMKERLDLTPEQVEKIKPILEGDRQKLMALRQNTALSREQKMEKMRDILKDSMETIRPILKPDQLKKWKAEMEKRREGGRGLPGRAGRK